MLLQKPAIQKQVEIHRKNDKRNMTNLQVTTSSSNYRPAKEDFELNFANIHPKTISLWSVMSSKNKQK